MPAPELRTGERDVAARSGGVGILARIYWMFAGNAALAVVAALIASSGATLSWRDLAYGAIASSLVAVRYADVTVLGGTTADGTAATRAHWRRYAVALSAVCAAVWVLAHVAARFNAR